MLLALRAVILGVVAFIASFLTGFSVPSTVEAPLREVPVASVPEVATTTEALPPPVAIAPTSTPAKPAAPKPTTPGALTPGSPEYEKALQDALDALAALNATQPVPAGSVNDRARAAVVNILCTTDQGGPFSPISASGVVIDSRGIILTNAHVAQYLLLKDYPRPGFVDCIVRTGSPARAMYTTTLLFISPSWIEKNAGKITEDAPTGTGEHDYALIVITGVTGPSVPIPNSFPFLPLAAELPKVGQKAVIVGYPAGFLGGITVQKDLYESSAEATVGNLYTFGSNLVELFSVGGTILSQHGSSGGAVVNTDGQLMGLVVTATDAAETADRDLRALATPYIIRDFAREAQVSFARFMSGDILEQAAAFNAFTAPTLTQTLIDAIEQ